MGDSEESPREMARPSPSESRFERIVLTTPPLACVVPDGVFDAYAWNRSTRLEWLRPKAWDHKTELRPDLPERLLFIFRDDIDWLPRELARYHAPAFEFDDEYLLAPYAIDDATDGLFERGVDAGSVFYLATDNLNALFWGLHDWVHFHNHGPFEARAWTEYQCDLTALSWIFENLGRIGLTETEWDALLAELRPITEARFSAEALAAPPVTRERVFALATPPSFL